MNEHVGNLAGGRQNPGEFGLVVAGEAEAAGGDDGNAQAQADVLAAATKRRLKYRIEDGFTGGKNRVRLTPLTGRWRRCRKAPASHTRFHHYSAGRGSENRFVLEQRRRRRSNIYRCQTYDDGWISNINIFIASSQSVGSTI